MDGYYTTSSRGQYEKTRVVLFCVLIDFDFVSVHKNAQKKTGARPIPSHVDLRPGQ